MTDLLVKHALVVTCDAQGTVIRDGALSVEDGRIAWLGPTAEAATLSPRPERVMDASGHILMPGLINAHCHAGDSLFRGLVENLPLEPWLQTVWKAEAAILNRQTTRLGSVLGFAELALAGVTTVMDMFWYPDETVAAAREVGIRVSTGGIFFDPPGVTGHDLKGRIAEAERFLERFGEAEDVLPAVMPHGAYTVAPDNLKIAKEIADRHDALYSTHAAETRAEVADISTRYGRTVIRHLDHLGLLDSRTVLAHCVHLDEEEIEIVARSGASVVHNPMSNLKLASGVARVPDLLAAGIPVALGTDGAISGNDLDPWLALRLAATLHKGVSGRADVVSTAQALAMATSAGARALNAGDRIGSLETGKFADMILIDIRRPHAVPVFDPVTHLVYSAAKSDVRHVFVGGRPVVEDGRLVRLDIGETIAAVEALAPRIAASIA
jgi:5-methylthioadenosine/S-adenosylhomocysteine deaminase